MEIIMVRSRFEDGLPELPLGTRSEGILLKAPDGTVVQAQASVSAVGSMELSTTARLGNLHFQLANGGPISLGILQRSLWAYSLDA